MIDPMRHMGFSGKIAIGAACAALGMLVLTAISLEESVMFTFLGLAAIAYVAAVSELFIRARHVAVAAAGVGSSLTIAFSLAFVSTWELAFADQSSFFGTPLPIDDPDHYFFLAAASALATLLVLFTGIAWPAGKRLRTADRKKAAARRRPAPGRRPAATAGTRDGGAAAQRTGAKASAGQRASGSRTPAARVPAPAAKRPSSSASQARKPAPKPAPKPGSKSGSKSASRR
jgi:hypothetical protein